jgi:hypothetical protein
MKKFWISVISVCIILALTFISCSKEDNNNNTSDENELSDQEIYERANNKTGFVYYKNITDTLTAAAASPHKTFILVRFNDVALNVIGPDGKLQPGKSFPDESIIVNEIYQKKGGKPDRIAVMIKRPKDINSESGWLWTEFKTDGSAKVSAADKGSQCVSCHAGQGNKDLVLTFSLH